MILLLNCMISFPTENVVSMNAAQSETPFGSKVRKGMFRTVSQLYKVSEELKCLTVLFGFL